MSSRPSLRALRGFAETARAGNLAGASRALNVTPSAVSHLLRELEQSLALTLFVIGAATQSPAIIIFALLLAVAVVILLNAIFGGLILKSKVAFPSA